MYMGNMDDDDGSDEGMLPIFGPNMEALGMLDFGNLNIAAHVGLNGNDDMFDDVMFDDEFFDDDDSFDDEMGYFMSDYEDDSEEGTSESSERQKKIFCTLQDSFIVLPRLRFHKDQALLTESLKEKMFRLPRLNNEKHESYESLYRLLEELELLIKVWRRRVQHPYTAHLQRRNDVLQEKSNQELNGEDDEANSSYLNDRTKLFPGVDYSETDVESDAESVYKNNTNVSSTSRSNESLTKKKYCQSTRLYYDIFDTEHEVDNLAIMVKKCRKFIFHIIFNLFMDALPADCAHKLPTELWEKIWRLTQVPFDHQEKDTFLAGARAYGHPRYLVLEQDRTTNLFASVGNLHMIVFEILFKHPNIVTAPPVIDMESVGARHTHNMPYCKAVFQQYLKQFIVAFARLRELDNLDLKQKSVEYRKENIEQDVDMACVKNSSEHEENIEVKSEPEGGSEGESPEWCKSSTAGTIVSKGDCEGTINANDDTESMTSAISALSLARTATMKSSIQTNHSKTSNDVMYKIERGIYEVQSVQMDISELNMREVDYNVNFYPANEICRDPIVLTTDEQTRYLAVLGYKQSNRSNATNAYIVVWDVMTKKSVVRIETNSNILNIFASPKSKDLFCLSKNRFAFLYPLKEYEPMPLQGSGPTTTANFQKVRKLQREACELHEWTWDPSDPPMTSSEEICLNSSTGKQYTIDLLSVKKNDMDEKNLQREKDRPQTWTCQISNCGTLNGNRLSECAECDMPRPKNSLMPNGHILEAQDEGTSPIGAVPDLILKTTVVESGTVVHLIGQFVSDINHSSIIIVDADSGSVIDKVIFNGFLSPTSVVTEKFEVSQNRLLLRKFSTNRVTQLDIFQANASEIIFFDLESRCEITSYKSADLNCHPKNKCKHGKEPTENDTWGLQAEKACNYIAKFDVNPRRKQFLIYSQNLTFYQLMEYSNEEMDSPQVLLVGSTYLYELTERTFNNILLSNGILFSAPIFEIYPKMKKEYHPGMPNLAALAVFAINLHDQKTTKCPLISVMEEKSGLVLSLMNECSRSIFWDKKDKRDANFAGISKFTQRFLHLVDDYTLTVSIGNATYLHIDMSISGKEVAEREATQLYNHQIIKQKLERERIKREAEIQRIEKEKEAKRKIKDKERIEVIDKLRKKYVDKSGSEYALQGKIHTWKKSYGFVRAKGEAKDLGNIFVHITDVKNKKKGKYPNRNKWIQFFAKYDPKQSSLRAADVILIERPMSNDTNDSASSSSKLNGKVEIAKLSNTHKAGGKASNREDQKPSSSKRRFHKFKSQKKPGQNHDNQQL